MYLIAVSQNEFIELIGHQIRQRVIQDIKGAGMYSVMADTTPSRIALPLPVGTWRRRVNLQNVYCH
jgi:hypothetical protein